MRYCLRKCHTENKYRWHKSNVPVLLHCTALVIFCTFCPLALSAVGPFACFYNVLDLSSFGPSVFCTKHLLYQASFVPSALWTIRLLYHVPCTKRLWTKCLWTNYPGTPILALFSPF